MAVVVVCAGMVVLALGLALRWRDRSFEPPPPVAHPSAREVARRFAWYCSLVLTAGIAAGLLVIGGGGRLAMRLLAATAGDDAQGRITEADEVVGEITVDGTIGFVVFNGIFGGVVSAGLYLVVRRLLPPGWLGGVLYGAILLVVLGTTIDPLRKDNRDFDIVGPGWLSVLVFAALALAFGAVLATFVARASQWLPLLAAKRAVLVRYVLPALLAAVAFSVTAFLGVLCLLVMAATRWRPLVAAVRSPMAVRIGQGLLAALVVVALPGAVMSVIDILER